MRIILPALLLCTACVTTAPLQQPAPKFVATELELTVKDVDADLVAQLPRRASSSSPPGTSTSTRPTTTSPPR